MSKSKQQSNRTTQALRRRGQSLPLKPLDSEQRFIDDFMPLQRNHNGGKTGREMLSYRDILPDGAGAKNVVKQTVNLRMSH
jgi:hypothetical protein